LPLPVDEILKDYRLAYQSRQASVIGRREVFSGRAKFGIFGDGKELANLAIAHAFSSSDGDYWSMPNVESIFDAVYEMMSEVDPEVYPKIY
jgi:hypothetical protein